MTPMQRIGSYLMYPIEAAITAFEQALIHRPAGAKKRSKRLSKARRSK